MADAQARGWGAPPVDRSKIVTVHAGGVSLPVHGGIADLVGRLCEETVRRGYPLDAKADDWGYSPRKIRGSDAWSNHAWGLAVDLNATANPMGSTLITDMPQWMVKLWEAYGFRWGGRYITRPDAMHYEYMGTPTTANADTVRATRDMGGLRSGDDEGTARMRNGDQGAEVGEWQQSCWDWAHDKDLGGWSDDDLAACNMKGSNRKDWCDRTFGPSTATATKLMQRDNWCAQTGRTSAQLLGRVEARGMGVPNRIRIAALGRGHTRQHERLAALEELHPDGRHAGGVPADPPGGFGIPDGYELADAVVFVKATS